MNKNNMKTYLQMGILTLYVTYEGSGKDFRK